MEKVIKIGLSILLLLCLADMPYGFFQLVRFLSLIGFGILAFSANQKERQTETIIYIALAILFQPLFKISLGRSLWNVVDVVVAIGLILSLLSESNKKGK
jgi:hypothetical protein